MAGQLIEKGFELSVWNRDPAKAGPLLARGAKWAASPKELAGQVDVIIAMVRDDAAVREVWLGAEGAVNGARAGTTFINMSTTTPGLAVELSATLAARGCAFLDAPVTGSKAAAAGGQLGVLVGGSPEALEANRDVLAAMGQTVTHIGPVGASATLKLANNSLAATVVLALGEALALCEKAGLEREFMVESFAATVARVCGLKKKKIVERDWSTDFALELMCKDLDQALDTARRSGVSVPLFSAVRERYLLANDETRRGADFSVVADHG